MKRESKTINSWASKMKVSLLCLGCLRLRRTHKTSSGLFFVNISGSWKEVLSIYLSSYLSIYHLSIHLLIILSFPLHSIYVY